MTNYVSNAGNKEHCITRMMSRPLSHHSGPWTIWQDQKHSPSCWPMILSANGMFLVSNHYITGWFVTQKRLIHSQNCLFERYLAVIVRKFCLLSTLNTTLNHLAILNVLSYVLKDFFPPLCYGMQAFKIPADIVPLQLPFVTQVVICSHKPLVDVIFNYYTVLIILGSFVPNTVAGM